MSCHNIYPTTITDIRRKPKERPKTLNAPREVSLLVLYMTALCKASP